MQPLEIKRIRVRAGALDLEVAASLDTLYVDDATAHRILDVLPNLAHHVCVNATDNATFGDELVGTELPHLLEHVIIELMGRAARMQGAFAPTFTGHTSWLEELDATAPAGYALMRVTVTFANDFVALAAMNSALAIIAWACDPTTSPRPDVEAAIAQLVAHS